MAPGKLLVLTEAQGGKATSGEAGELVFWCFSLCLERALAASGDRIAAEPCRLLRSLTERDRHGDINMALLPELP
jgi:hypothetical protein